MPGGYANCWCGRRRAPTGAARGRDYGPGLVLQRKQPFAAACR